jgi:ribosomal protein L15
MEVNNGNNALATAREALNNAVQDGTVTQTLPQTQITEPEQVVEANKTVDLKELGKFVFEGKEVTYDDLKKSHMLQSDYTRKTQELASQRQYAENIGYDLENLAANPNQLAKFKEIYPASYHQAAEKVVAMARGRAQESEQPRTKKDEATELQAKTLQEINDIKERLDMTERQKASVVIDKIVGELGSKYELADQDMVQAKAAFLMQQTGRFLPLKEWENLFKESHVQTVEKTTKYFKSKLTTQQQANQAARDSAPGGQALGKAAPKTLEEARLAMMKDFTR